MSSSDHPVQPLDPRLSLNAQVAFLVRTVREHAHLPDPAQRALCYRITPQNVEDEVDLVHALEAHGLAAEILYVQTPVVPSFDLLVVGDPTAVDHVLHDLEKTGLSGALH